LASNRAVFAGPALAGPAAVSVASINQLSATDMSNRTRFLTVFPLFWDMDDELRRGLHPPDGSAESSQPGGRTATRR